MCLGQGEEGDENSQTSGVCNWSTWRPLLESKAVVGEKRIQIHAGHTQLEMALALHTEVPSALGC